MILGAPVNDGRWRHEPSRAPWPPRIVVFDGLAEAIESLAADYLAQPADESESVVIDIVGGSNGSGDDVSGDPVASSCAGATAPVAGAPTALEVALADCDEEMLQVVLDSVADPIERDRLFRWWVLHRDGWVCQMPWCEARRELEVDHIVSRSAAPHRRWDPSNVATLCAACHEAKTRGTIVYQRLPDGTIRVRRPPRWHASPETPTEDAAA